MDRAQLDGQTMLAVVYRGPGQLLLEERPIPTIGPGEALLKVLAAGICGTDLRILHGGHRKYPPGTVRVPGHEVAGEIVAVGSKVRGLTPGQRVFVAPNMGCGKCPQCALGNNNLCAGYDAFGITLDGGFAQYMRITQAAIAQGNVIPIEDAVDPATAALIEPFACVLRGQSPLNIKPTDLVLIVGAGPIGIMHLLLARLRGAQRVVMSETVLERQAKAAEFGADRVVDPTRTDLARAIAEESGGRGADVIVVAAPSPHAQAESLRLAAVGGRVNLFAGLPRDHTGADLDPNLIHYKELRVTGTTGCSTSDCQEATAIVTSGRLDLSRIVSARFPLSAIQETLAAAIDRRCLRVVLDPQAVGKRPAAATR
jgi:L-iditol 2-dehydrogenase